MKLRNNNSSHLEKEYTPGKNEPLYYVKAGITTASITLYNHDRSYEIASAGIKTLERMDKYQVDVLGNYTRIEKEKRQTFR